MSLLMDALKKAEAAKQQAQSSESRPQKLDFSIDDDAPSPPAAPSSPLPELAHHSASVDAELASAVSTASRSSQPPAHAERHTVAERQAARNVFNAKQPATTRSRLWIFLALTGAAALLIAAYFWWQLQSINTAPLNFPPAAPSPAPAQPSPAPSLPPSTSALPAAALTERPPATRTPPPANSASTATIPAKAPEVSLTRTPHRASAMETPHLDLKQTPKSLATPKNAELHFNKTTGSTLLENAYDALQAQRLEEAQVAYARVLRGDSRNLDALLGLATIAVRQGKADEGLAWYQRALEVDPNDPTAQAALVNLKGQGDPGLAESRLQTAIASQPDSAALHFALGNLYARQQRWSEAQQAYFTAFTREGNNADYLFNLAVSLDHLHQNKLAAQYYQMALNAAQTARSISFDPNLARKRAFELQP